jgi:predicted amidohydrolase
MKICAIQTQPVTGSIQSNITRHKQFVQAAIAQHVDVIIFPELSLTGYEPTLAKDLAVDMNDHRLDDFQTISNEQTVTIGVGIPIRTEKGIIIGMIVFQPNYERSVYAKRYIHPDEEEFFVSGESFPTRIISGKPVALAICYEISVPAHAEKALRNGAVAYIASVAKFTNGVDKATQRLSEIAATYHVPVVMSNCIGPADNGICAGKTSAWSAQGILLGQLDESREGMILLDTETNVAQQILL